MPSEALIAAHTGSRLPKQAKQRARRLLAENYPATQVAKLCGIGRVSVLALRNREREKIAALRVRLEAQWDRQFERQLEREMKRETERYLATSNDPIARLLRSFPASN